MSHPAPWWAHETPANDGLGMYDVPDEDRPDAYDIGEPKDAAT